MSYRVYCLIFIFPILQSCGVYEGAQKFAKMRKASLFLAKENRVLKKEIIALKFKVNELKNKNEFLTLSNENRINRSIASVIPVNPENDLVEYHVYRWSPQQLLSSGKKAFSDGDFEKSSQFLKTLVFQFPRHQLITDEIFYKLGISSYESGSHLAWAKESFEKIIETYPHSNYFRSAKLWRALINLKKGNKKSFFLTVEEFRKKYRNTDEWKLISRHYDTIYKNYR